MGRRDQPSVGAVERLRHGGLSRPFQLSPWIISDVACANPGIAGGHTHTQQKYQDIDTPPNEHTLHV